ncbi:hypothetical protein IJ818_04270 [bacterium]|nr:hypothetical protein [bacterium]
MNISNFLRNSTVSSRFAQGKPPAIDNNKTQTGSDIEPYKLNGPRKNTGSNSGLSIEEMKNILGNTQTQGDDPVYSGNYGPNPGENTGNTGSNSGLSIKDIKNLLGNTQTQGDNPIYKF